MAQKSDTVDFLTISCAGDASTRAKAHTGAGTPDTQALESTAPDILESTRHALQLKDPVFSSIRLPRTSMVSLAQTRLISLLLAIRANPFHDNPPLAGRTLLPV